MLFTSNLKLNVVSLGVLIQGFQLQFSYKYKARSRASIISFEPNNTHLQRDPFPTHIGFEFSCRILFLFVLYLIYLLLHLQRDHFEQNNNTHLQRDTLVVIEQKVQWSASDKGNHMIGLFATSRSQRAFGVNRNGRGNGVNPAMARIL